MEESETVGEWFINYVQELPYQGPYDHKYELPSTDNWWLVVWEEKYGIWLVTFISFYTKSNDRDAAIARAVFERLKGGNYVRLFDQQEIAVGLVSINYKDSEFDRAFWSSPNRQADLNSRRPPTLVIKDRRIFVDPNFSSRYLPR